MRENMFADSQSLEQAVFMAVGAATVGCWDENGVFVETRARTIAEDLLEMIAQFEKVKVNQT